MEERQEELNQRAAVILRVTTWLCEMGTPNIARHSVYVHCISLDPKPYIYTNI